METAPLSADSRLARFVEANPANVRVLERLGLDFCCRGNRPLAEACAELGLDPAAVLAELTAAPAAPEAAVKDWENLPTTALVEHILSVHHTYLQRVLPELDALMNKVTGKHGTAHPELRELDAVFSRLHKEINEHLYKEEVVLFPAIRSLSEGNTPALRGPLLVMLEEHLHADDGLRRMREITKGYAPPVDACTGFCRLYKGLEELEADLHLHIHKENRVLFPRIMDAAEAIPEPITR